MSSDTKAMTKFVEFVTYSNPEKKIFVNPEKVEVISDNLGHARLHMTSGEEFIVKASPAVAREQLENA